MASVLGRQHASLTEQSLMLLGGEWFHMKKHALSSLKLSEQDPETLKVRVTLASDLAIAEKRWRDRLLAILEKGKVPKLGLNDGKMLLLSFHRISMNFLQNVLRTAWQLFQPAVAGMNDMSVIGQHNSITSIRRLGKWWMYSSQTHLYTSSFPHLHVLLFADAI